jgi:hypothetical protein
MRISPACFSGFLVMADLVLYTPNAAKMHSALVFLRRVLDPHTKPRAHEPQEEI